jgi:hypothetical protein
MPDSKNEATAQHREKAGHYAHLAFVHHIHAEQAKTFVRPASRTSPESAMRIGSLSRRPTVRKTGESVTDQYLTRDTTLTARTELIHCWRAMLPSH